MLIFYHSVTSLAAPLMPFYLRYRQGKGKEQEERLSERLGTPSVARPNGALLWIHAASVGEANAALPLLERLKQEATGWNFLLTTGTVTSATLMQRNLPDGVIHQYVPIDTPRAARRFVRHWQPDIGIFIESELWPNLLRTAYATGAKLLLVNARMSPRSFSRWSRIKAPIRRLLSHFIAIFAQSEDDAQRFRDLGFTAAEAVGNLKYESLELPADGEVLVGMQEQLEERPVWLAASTHPGEEIQIAKVHAHLKQQYPNLLTIITPRHPQRGEEVVQELTVALPALTIRRRSTQGDITPETDIYVADTLGELGLFYRLCTIVFIGGSLVKHGGQNPLEPARLGCAILAGQHTENFTEIVDGLEAANALQKVGGNADLAQAVEKLLEDPALASGMAARASAWVLGKGGVNDKIIEYLAPLLKEKEQG